MQDQEDTRREQADEDVAAHMWSGTLNVNETVVEENDQTDKEASEDVDEDAQQSD
jgi:hypothetical protein